MASLHLLNGTGSVHHGAIAPGYTRRPAAPPRPGGIHAGHRAQARRPDRGVPRHTLPTGSGRPSHQARRRRPTSRSLAGRGGRARSAWSTDQVVTESLVREPTCRRRPRGGGRRRDLVKIAVVERHLATGRVGLGFVTGSGSARGALASTVAHDAHNSSSSARATRTWRRGVAGSPARRRRRRGRGRDGAGRVPAPDRRVPLGRAARRRDRPEPSLQRRSRRRSAGRGRRRS